MDTMNLKSFRKWIRHIYNTQEEELDCEAFARVIPQYVDMEISGGQAEVRFSKVKQHLIQCSECCDLYRTLYDMALIESREVTRTELAELEGHEAVAERAVWEPS